MLPENHGHNEKILGEAVREYRRNVVLATKLHIGTDEVTEKCRCKVCVTKLCKNAQLSWFGCKALCVMISTDY